MAVEKPKSKMRTWGISLTIIGAVVLVLSVVVGIIITAVSGGKVGDMASEFQSSETGSGIVTVEPDTDYRIYVDNSEGSTPYCSVSTESYESIELEDMGNTTETFTQGNTEWGGAYKFNSGDNTQLSVTCDSGPIAVGPPVDVSGILGAVGGIFLAIGGGILGFFILIIGVILWIIGANRRKNKMNNQAVDNGWHAPQGTDPNAGYGQQQNGYQQNNAGYNDLYGQNNGYQQNDGYQQNNQYQGYGEYQQGSQQSQDNPYQSNNPYEQNSPYEGNGQQGPDQQSPNQQ